VNSTPGHFSKDRDGEAHDLNDAAVQYAQAALDALHVENLLGHIPVVRSALAAANAVGSVRDHLLLRKLAIFLHALTAISQNDRRSMVARLQADPDFAENVGEYLIDLLDQTDGQRKPAMIGAVFTAYAFQQIDARTLRRLNAVVKQLLVTEIGAVRAVSTKTALPDRYAILALSNAGLAEPILSNGKVSYSLNEVGEKFLELELDRVRPRGN
jgi:hypothetical protein